MSESFEFSGVIVFYGMIYGRRSIRCISNFRSAKRFHHCYDYAMSVNSKSKQTEISTSKTGLHLITYCSYRFVLKF